MFCFLFSIRKLREVEARNPPEENVLCCATAVTSVDAGYYLLCASRRNEALEKTYKKDKKLTH